MNLALLASLNGQFFSSGIVTQTADGMLTIQSAPGRYITWIVAFLVLVPLSLWLWRRGLGGRLAPGVFFASFTIPLIVLPGIALEKVSVTPDSISIRMGMWFAPTDCIIPLTDLDAVIETSASMRQLGIQRHDTNWEFLYHSSPPFQIALSDLLQANRAHVVQYLREHGFQVRNA